MTHSTPIAGAAKAALAKHEAAQQAAVEAAAIGRAKAVLARPEFAELDQKDLTWSYVDGGSVVVSDGKDSLSVDPQQQVWLVQPEGDGWADAQPVTSLVDAARLLGLA